MPIHSPTSRYSEETLLIHALRVFRKYNHNKIKFLQDELPARKRIVFDLVPLLLHFEARGLLWDDEVCADSPHGVYGFEMTPQVEESFHIAFSGRPIAKERYRASFDPRMPVKSMALIGSLGSVAQNSKSDFDYWICVDLDADKARLNRLKKKLLLIEKWAKAFAKAEVHFFPIMLSNLKKGDFGQIRGESAGTALGKLLLEELYRSLTLVTGKTPLWWVMPPGTDDRDYARLKELATNSDRLDYSELIDMGNVQEISLGEFYGAAIWHINKTINSPFKSVLKLALLEEYMIREGGNGLLCNELKQRLFSNEEETEYLDPYILVFERASRYLEEQGRIGHLDLLRKALYLKSGVKLLKSDQGRMALPRKKRVMARLVNQWGWSQETLAHLNRHRFWSFSETIDFSDDINSFIKETYRIITEERARRLSEEELAINQRDLTILGRKLFIFYSRRPYKVDSIRNVIEQPPVLYGMTIKPFFDEEKRTFWAAYRGFLSPERIGMGDVNAFLLKRSTTLTGIMIWLVKNRLFDHGTSIHLGLGSEDPVTFCTIPDLHQLLKEMQAFFPVLNVFHLKEEDLLEKPRPVRVMVVINVEYPDHFEKMVQVEVIHQTSWGEIFHRTFDDPSEGLGKARDLARELPRTGSDRSRPPEGFKVFFPRRQYRRHFLEEIKRILGFKILEPKESILHLA